jgi:glycosidase
MFVQRLEEILKANRSVFLTIALNRLERKKYSPGLSGPWREFHVSRETRLKYQFAETLFESNGNVIIANFHAARVFSQKINEKRDVINFPERAIRAGQVNAMGLIDEILHYVVQLYRQDIDQKILPQALEWLNERMGEKEVQQILQRFTEDFPPREVYFNNRSLEDYLSGQTGEIPHVQLALEELLLLWLANMNPAFAPFLELFDDDRLQKHPAYQRIFPELHAFFEQQPKFGPDNENLIDMLRSPAKIEPYSLTGQLEYIRSKWGFLLEKFFYRLLRSLDLIQEEEKERRLGVGLAEVYQFRGLEFEPERFSLDKDWMPRVVLMAKSTYVWLDQLSKKYQRSITRLDQIPDEELDRLAGWGFTGLWLIGLWERSQASQRIKQWCGNPEAVASAYSLYDYQIASELGGEEAFANLRKRAWQRGIRMAGDMVPNHMGIDSRWVIEHPDWFVQLHYSPYPAYTFNGGNVSWDGRVGLYIEDHYYSRNDAAVVFKRVDFHTGDTRYIYHGNDGTSMPWNDTAQLNYLKPEVREAVIQTILHVARNFPIIRFDAAMTLTKKHYQRLWFPEPGHGGDIPSRAEHGLSKGQFDAAMPEEFWREVVDRVAREVPDTLLLAEAFWLMEGYFVRTLGMHRVYNSAFMNMLKNEHNDKYRSSIKNILEFNPEILKRFVNFMNNPDEATAVAQFGKGDKYIGVCIMLVTMPGLPMIGHGQVEGFTEKYGMEYRKAYWNEESDRDLISRHERYVFPIMRRRYIFAEVINFYLYDFYTDAGQVNENVFAYSNSFHNEYGLVIYHNKFENTSGWIKMSAAYSVKTGNGEERMLMQKSLGDALALHHDTHYFVIFRDHVSGLEFIRRSRNIHEQGLFMSLAAYQYQVFWDFREVEDNVWQHYANLEAYLGGRGVPSIDEALKETFLKPIHQTFKELANKKMFESLYAARLLKADSAIDKKLSKEVSRKMLNLLNEIKKFNNGKGETSQLIQQFEEELTILLGLLLLDKTIKCPKNRMAQKGIQSLTTFFTEQKSRWQIWYAWILVHQLGAAVDPLQATEQSRAGLDDWLLGKILEQNFYELGLSFEEVQRIIPLIKILTTHQNWWQDAKDPEVTGYQIMQKLLQDGEVQSFLQVNRYREVLWFNKESFTALVDWLLNLAILEAVRAGKGNNQIICKEIKKLTELIEKFKITEEKSDYQLEKLLESLK